MSEQLTSNIFMERSGVGVGHDVELLIKEPEHPLSDAERAEAFAFAHGLIDGQAEGFRAETPKTLAEINNEKATAEQLTFYVDYFLDSANEEGRKQLYNLGYRGLWDREDIKHFFVQAPEFRDVKYKDRSELATKSLDYTKDTLASHLLMDPEGKTDFIFNEWDSVTCHYEPEALLGKFQGLLAYRAFYKEVGKAVNGQEGDLADAKKLLVGMHKGKINAMLADLYPDLLKLKGQLGYMQPEAADSLREHIDALSPVIKRLFDTEQEKAVDNFHKNLDYLRNGIVLQQGQDGLKAGPVTNELLELLAEQDVLPGFSEVPLIPEEERDAMGSTTWTAAELEGFIEEVIGSWGQLSAEKSTWEEVAKREGPAADGLVQVVVTPKAKQLSVDNKNIVVKIPEKFSRTLTQGSPAGALIVTAHELTHVAQGIADRELAKTIPLAGIKGRHVSTVREAGGLFQETIIHNQYLGRSRPVSANYLRALQVKLAGGNRVEASRAFFENYLQEEQIGWDNQAGLKKAADLAIDRTLRLYRNGGHNSQPLDYAEQGLIVSALQRLSPEQASMFVMASGSFDVKEAARLHAFGLLPKIDLPYRPAEDVMRIYQEKISPMVYTPNNESA